MTNREISEKATAIISENRQRALAEADSLKFEAYSRCPQLYDIDASLAQVAGEIAVNAVSGNMPAIEKIREKIGELHQKKKELLTEAGFNPEDLQPKFSCPKCKDTGYVNGKRCECFNKIFKTLCVSNLPEKVGDEKCSFLTFNLDYYSNIGENNPRAIMKTIYDICLMSAENIPNVPCNLLLMGNTGLGKTHLAISIGNLVADNGGFVQYYSAQQLIDCHERVRFRNNPEPDDYDALKNAQTAELLIIDDLGSEHITAFSQSVIYNIINDRFVKGLSTVITTNLDAKKLMGTYEQRISSRLLCGYRSLQFAGKDIRYIKRMRA